MRNCIKLKQALICEFKKPKPNETFHSSNTKETFQLGDRKKDKPESQLCQLSTNNGKFHK